MPSTDSDLAGPWGDGLFESESDLKLIHMLDAKAGFLHNQITIDSISKGLRPKKFVVAHYSMLSVYSSGEEVELMRNKLEKGELESIMRGIRDSGQTWVGGPAAYALCLVGACAMTLGCRLPAGYKDMMKDQYRRAISPIDGFGPKALMQLHKALYGPDGYEEGVRYTFDSKSVIDAVVNMRTAEREKYGKHYVYHGAATKTKKSSGVELPKLGIIITSGEDLLMREGLRVVDEQADFKFGMCGGCGKIEDDVGNPHSRCAKCQWRWYCSRECQKGDWKWHKALCKAAEQTQAEATKKEL